MRQDALRLGLLLRQSHRKAATALEAALAPLGLSGRHFGILMLLSRDGSSTQRDLLRQTGSDKAGLARSVADLEALGLIERQADDRDRRLIHLRLSDLGRERFQQALGLASAVGDDLVVDLDDAELSQLVSLLQRIVDPSGGATDDRARSSSTTTAHGRPGRPTG